MSFQKIIDQQRQEDKTKNTQLQTDLSGIVGSENVITNFTDLIAYGRDRWPFANLHYRFGHFPLSVPAIVALPGTYEEVSELLRFASNKKLTVLPYGFGSGVLGGAIPTKNEIIVDLKRLNTILEIDTLNNIATAEAGTNGELFEAALNKKMLTLGHFPQSLNISTIGGWLSCRSAGQASSRYGKIEDMVVGLKVVLPNGEMVTVKPAPRRAVGPSIKDIFVGSEGTLGIIVEGTFRVWPYPEREAIHVFGFKDYIAGLDAIRKIMQTELRPAVIRLYDETESRSKIEKFAEYKDHPCLCMITLNGKKELVEVEERLSLDILAQSGGIEGDPEPAYEWMKHRFESLSAKPIFQRRMMDTIEIAGSWTALPELYESMKGAVLRVRTDAHVGAHWSHAYSDGACMYMTVIIPASDEQQASQEMRRIWDGAMNACLAAGGTISHHHGIGYFRGQWMEKELDTGFSVLKQVKSTIDPYHIMNPGKLGL